MKRPEQQRFHEPVGFSPEDYQVSRRYLVTLIMTILLIGAAAAGYLYTAARI